ncbi:adenylyl-sulfate kinase [Paenibacillus radicis (ex Xue et al. 2023)]|uniref:Adenylyl-sulfate kinase n=1 Tax=Paenibacillus radicis (ex Xue et al. 2023) TaxID=2972489 RepID=A0ABT1YBV6_9BACL|nr:adenylyl-sulfate kinase [Paenibacillus radicis (ex Xue et al. 2023)]MCR8630668.1 adenylyl-sulfate kinase [Paenibacillus radicis (ex Xue et al. 2023)]
MESSSGNVLWFTGLSGSGKTTTAQHIYKQLTEAGQQVELLDGDEIRSAICKGLGFSREDRLENIRRIAYVANLLSKHGVLVLVSAITPYREMREYLRNHILGYVEIYVKCPLDVCEARDVKGLYAKARRQEITMFTGISDAYEEPEQADIVIDTDRQSVHANALQIVQWITRYTHHVDVGSVQSCVAASQEMERVADLAGLTSKRGLLEGDG